MPGYGGVDFIDFDSQLNNEEKLVRQTARQFVENEIIPIIEKAQPRSDFPKHLVRNLASWDFLVRTCMVMAARECQRRVRIDDAGTGARRFRIAAVLFRCRARW